jgi:hypothetical protein
MLNKIWAGTTATLVVISMFLGVNLWLTKNALESAAKTAREHPRIIQSQDRITEFENRLDLRLNELEQQIEDSPNAQILIPADVATIWANGIDGLRDTGSDADESTKQLRRSDADKA